MTSVTPPSESDYPMVINTIPNEPEAPLGYEPDGASCCGDSYSDDNTKPLSKSNHLLSLMDSKNGSKSFQRYLEKTNPNHYHMLRFLLACKGLSESSVENAHILIKVIYTRFIVEKQFVIDEDLRDAVTNRIEEANRSGSFLPRAIFNDICVRILQIIDDEMYPNYLAYRAQKQKISKSRGSHDCRKHLMEQCPYENCHRNNYKSALPPQPEKLAKVLMERLEQVQKNEVQKNEQVPKNEEPAENVKPKEHKSPLGVAWKDFLVQIISNKFPGNNENKFEDGEDILDQHIKVWEDGVENDASTTCASHKYSDSKRYTQPRTMGNIPHPYSGTGTVRQKSKDMYSAFSKDSGFSTAYSGYSSDSVTKYASYDDERCPRQAKPWNGSRQTLTDSGASMYCEDEDQYMQYTEKMYERRPEPYRGNRPGDGAEHGWYKRRMVDAQVPIKDRHTFINEIPSVSMYSLNSNDSYASLEEARRRLLRNEMKQKMRSPAWNGGSYPAQPCPSSKTDRSDVSGFTTVVYNFNDEKMPYRVRIHGSRITLKQFKESLPKKGNYRYFFITPCEDFGMEAVQEEITDDNQVLPLWEGKIDARIKIVK